MSKQLALEGLPVPERVRVTVQAHQFDFDPERNEVWPLPAKRKWEPKRRAINGKWRQMVDSVRRLVL